MILSRTGLDWTGLAKGGLAKGGLVKHGLARRGQVKRGFRIASYVFFFFLDFFCVCKSDKTER